jgi:ribonucleotide monophosphatase NagD (HAD superfamily)
MCSEIKVSPLGKTWIFDLDGTILKHNGYKTDGMDTLLPGAAEFLGNIPDKDMIIFLTSRKEESAEATENFLKENNIRFHHIIYNLPYGERILVNDKKPSGLNTAVAVNTERDVFMTVKVIEDTEL